MLHRPKSPPPSLLAFSLVLCLAASACGSTEGPVWPISGTQDPDRLSSTFGPRLQKSNASQYDFHRGIDIPVESGTSVYAIDAGKVTRAGNDPDYADMVVQIEHGDCSGSGSNCYYSNYLHLSDTSVEVGDEVDAGDEIGESGVSKSGFPHLHFEIRKDLSYQDHCIHPLHILPTPTSSQLTVTIVSVNDTDPAQTFAELQVQVPASAPNFVRLELTTSDRATNTPLEQRVFDVDEWNRKYTPKGNAAMIDDPDLENLHIDPAEFTEDSSVYSVNFRFNALVPAANPGDLHVTARAVNVHGTDVTVEQ